jgi:hypothetical protein
MGKVVKFYIILEMSIGGFRGGAAGACSSYLQQIFEIE